MTAPVYVLCECCGSEGRIYEAAPTYWEPYDVQDCGPCSACDGTGLAMIEDCDTAGEPEPIGVEALAP